MRRDSRSSRVFARSRRRARSRTGPGSACTSSYSRASSRRRCATGLARGRRAPPRPLLLPPPLRLRRRRPPLPPRPPRVAPWPHRLRPARTRSRLGPRRVSTSAQLASALSAGTANIVLADGTYGGSSWFTDAHGSNLYAQHPLAAVLTVGLEVGGNYGSGGAVVQGLAFDVSNASDAFQSSELNTWGVAGTNTQVLDCSFDGNWTVEVGLLAYNPDGLVAQRDTFTHFTDEGIRASNNQHAVLRVEHADDQARSATSRSNGVSRSTPGASSGTAEAGHLDRRAGRQRCAPDPDPQRQHLRHRDGEQLLEHRL